MPLLDHFHPPTTLIQDWESVHARWASALCDAFNAILPAPRFVAGVQVTVGRHIEADVVEFERPSAAEANGPDGGVAVQTWAPATATRTTSISFPDDIEVQVYDQRGGRRLIGVVELVSPSNKDRPDSRPAFAAKCSAYLHKGIGVVVVDVVTERHTNLHTELMSLLGEGTQTDLPEDCYLYAVAYRPVARSGEGQLDLWAHPLELGENLPTLPLFLRGAFPVPVELEATYAETRQRLHL